MPASTQDNDPYRVLTQSVTKLTGPLNSLLHNHDEFLLQNLSIMNNVATIPKVLEEIQQGLQRDKDNSNEVNK